MTDDGLETRSALELTKRENMGRLVNCVAHDINNLLTAVLSFSRFAIKSLPEDSQARADIIEVHGAAQRATVLTRSLTALMRKRGGKPYPTAINEMVSGVHRLVRRLIPEDVELVTLPATREMQVIVDPDRLWCLLAELLLVTSSGVGSGGKLTLEVVEAETGGGFQDEVLIELHGTVVIGGELGAIDLAPACRDLAGEAGCELEEGATSGDGPLFRLRLRSASAEDTARFWPPANRASAEAEGADPQSRRAGTILVVEDEPAILAVVLRILEGAGYRGLRASDGSEALRVSEAHDGAIDLLLSDVVTPQLNGPEIAERLARSRPEIRILFMTGYSAEEVWRGAGGRCDAPLLSKPFSDVELLAAVERVLASE